MLLVCHRYKEIIDMCLAVPVKIITLKENDMAVGECQGVRVDFSVALLENPVPGEYAIVHAGVAIEKLNEKEALETIALIKKVAGSEY